MEEIKGIDVHKLAVFMHDTYEKQAKETGWKTQDQCKVDFEDLPEEKQDEYMNGYNEEQLKSLVKKLAITLNDIGEQLDLGIK